MWARTSALKLAEAESSLLQSQRILLEPKAVDIGCGNHLHTLEVKGSAAAPEKVPIVLCHGYGLGLGAWTYNFETLSRGFDRIFAIDWLGCGRSSRPAFNCKGADETEQWFVDSLDRWREKNGLAKMILCGHSLGGYLSVCYAEKYPQHIHSLVLVGPVGVPEPPPDQGDLSTMPWGYRLALGTARNLWSWGVTPQSLIRTAGPWGKGIMESYIHRRVRDDVVDKDLMSEYLYHVSAAPGSGEHALSELLLPGAWAKKPLIGRIATLSEKSHFPISFVYGQNDWMNWKGGQEVVDSLPSPVREQSKVVRVPNAGHQAFMDNSIGFCTAVFSVCGIEPELAQLDAVISPSETPPDKASPPPSGSV